MKPLLITLGEPGGIGPDCLIRAWQCDAAALSGCIVVAPAVWLSERAEKIGITVPLFECASLEAAVSALIEQRPGVVCWNPLLPDMAAAPVSPGQTSSHTAAAVVHTIQTAAESCLNGVAAAMVTGPIEKAVLRDAGFQFPGHTEFLAHLARGQGAGSDDFAMMLASEKLRVALLTTHVALTDVSGLLSVDATLKLIRIVAADLERRFAIAGPRLALCALNPHGGEDGHFGHEEIDILMPAADAARGKGIDIIGPLPSDTLFSPAMRKEFDAIICCYHDQALIPIKALSFGESVNVTLGLPFIRTSVDHGTALDLVASDRVSSSSLLAAVAMARQMAVRSQL